LIVGELQVADVQAQVSLSLFTDFTDFTEFTPAEYQIGSLTALFDQVISWSNALAAVRQ